MNHDFEKYSQLVKLLPKQPNDNDLLILYGLYKQSIIGNCNIERPNGLFNIKEQKKWDAWNNIKDTSSDNAKELYINKVKELMTLQNSK
jgi:diazepam-binding inhibitor (GABA receptor modulating acyl-CoA-binding protein)